jgi:hypothetical protein
MLDANSLQLLSVSVTSLDLASSWRYLPLEVMHSVRVVPWHHEDVHFFEKARSPSGIGVHLAQECHGTLISGWLVAMNGSLKPHAKFGGVRRLAVRVAQESSEDWPSLFGLEVCNLVIEPIVSTCNAPQEIVQHCLVGWPRCPVGKRLSGNRVWPKEGRRMKLDIDVLICLGYCIVVFAGGRVVPTYIRLRRVLVKRVSTNGCTPYVGGGRNPAL